MVFLLRSSFGESQNTTLEYEQERMRSLTANMMPNLRILFFIHSENLLKRFCPATFLQQNLYFDISMFKFCENFIKMELILRFRLADILPVNKETHERLKTGGRPQQRPVALGIKFVQHFAPEDALIQGPRLPQNLQERSQRATEP